jgi:zinc transporter
MLIEPQCSRGRRRRHRDVTFVPLRARHRGALGVDKVAASDRPGGVAAKDAPLITDSHGLICAFELTPLSQPSEDALREEEGSGKTLWLHFNWADGRARDWLKQRARVPPAVVEALLEVDPYVHVQTLQDGFVAVLRDLNHEFTDAEAGFGSMSIYVDANRVISGRRQPLRTVDHLRRELSAGVALTSPVALFEHLVEKLAETFEGVVAKLARTVEQAEDEILAGRFGDKGGELRRVRWLLARLRRHASANRAALSRLPSHLPAAFGSERRQSLAQAIESFAGVAQDLELVEDRARLMQEEINARLSEASNRTLYLLSLVTTVLLPINLITGVFGMNVGGLPWLEDPNGFHHVIAWMTVAVLIALVLIGRWRALRGGSG